jgi:hypothetical protein
MRKPPLLPCYPLLNDLTAKVSIDKPPQRPLNRIHKAVVTDAVLPRKLRQYFGFDDTHHHPYSSINYSSLNYSSRKMSAATLRFGRIFLR